MTLNKTALAIAVLISCSSMAAAEEPNHGLTLGLGAIHISDHYIGDNDETLGVPLISYESDRFSIDVLQGLSYSVYRKDGLNVALRAAPRYTNLDDPDAPELNGIDRNATLDLGVGVDFNFGQNFVSTSLLTEVTGEYDGFEIDAKVGRVDVIGPASIAYAVGASFQSEKLANYQFGVRAPEALAARPAFTVDSAITPHIEALVEYPFSEKWSVISGGQLNLLTGDATDSPIVDSDTSYAVFTGVVRKF